MSTLITVPFALRLKSKHVVTVETLNRCNGGSPNNSRHDTRLQEHVEVSLILCVGIVSHALSQRTFVLLYS